MRDGGNTCTPVGSGAVDEQFWALVCEDEDWLDSEFDEIVSEPAESPTDAAAAVDGVCRQVPSRPASAAPSRSPGGTPTQYRAVVPGGPGGGNAHRPGREALAGNDLEGRAGGSTEREPRGGGVRSPARLPPGDADNPADGDKNKVSFGGHRIQRLVTLVQRAASAMSPAPKGGHRGFPVTAFRCLHRLPADRANPCAARAWRCAGSGCHQGHAAPGGCRCATTTLR